MTLAHSSTHPAPFPDRSDDPDAYDALRPALRAALDFWVSLAVLPAQSPDVFRSSVTMADDFERATGLRASNGQVKGALLAAGYQPIDRSARAWHCRIRPARQSVGPLNGTLSGYTITHVTMGERAQLHKLAAAAQAEAQRIRHASQR